jgi:hydroxyacylglutathione hydrolase
MLRASLERIAALAPEALVYCGHEYTAANLRFACAVDPSNALVREALARAESSGRTVPGRLTVERACNPFLRASLDVEFVVDGVTMRGDPDTVFAALRASKNLFRAT